MKNILFAIIAVSLYITPLYAAVPDRAAQQKLQELNTEMKVFLKKHDLAAADATAQKILALDLNETKYLTVIRAFCEKKIYGADYTRKYYEQAMGDKSLSHYSKLLCTHFYGTLLLNTSLDEEKAYDLVYAPFTDPGLTLKQKTSAFGTARGTFSNRAFNGEHEKIYRMFLNQIKADKTADAKDREAALSRLLSWRLGLLRQSPEATRTFCGNALKDPLFAQHRLTLICANAESHIGRAEAETAADALEKEIAEGMTPQDKLKIYSSMLNLYTDAAKRYYLPDNPAVLKKKLDTLRKMAEIPPDKVKIHMDMLLLADILGDTETSAETLKKLKNWNGVQKANASAFTTAYLAEKAYNTGDYKKASELCDLALAAAGPVHFYGDAKLLDMAVRSAAAMRNYKKALSYEPRVQKNSRQNRKLLEEMSVLKSRLAKSGK